MTTSAAIAAPTLLEAAYGEWLDSRAKPDWLVEEARACYEASVSLAGFLRRRGFTVEFLALAGLRPGSPVLAKGCSYLDERGYLVEGYTYSEVRHVCLLVDGETVLDPTGRQFCPGGDIRETLTLSARLAGWDLSRRYRSARSVLNFWERVTW